MGRKNNRAVEEFTEPIPMKGGNPRVKINGLPVRSDFRIISEDNYQILKIAYEKMCESNKIDTDNNCNIIGVISRYIENKANSCNLNPYMTYIGFGSNQIMICEISQEDYFKVGKTVERIRIDDNGL